MKYIYTIAGIILIILGISGITLFKLQPTSSKELARVNERVITTDEFEKEYRERAAVTPVPLDKKYFLENLITTQVLIQEAKRRGLDLKEPFRRSIQNYYEQTLIKNLMQERMSEIQLSVSEEDVNSYYKGMSRVYELMIVLLPTEQEANEAIKNFPSGKAEKKLFHIDEIPYGMVNDILTLKPGEVYRKPVPYDRGFYVLKLESYMTKPVPPLTEVRDEIRRTLMDVKKRLEMEKWLDDLKKKSSIKINEALLK